MLQEKLFKDQREKKICLKNECIEAILDLLKPSY